MPSSCREGRVLPRDTIVEGQGGIEPQRFVDAPLQILTVLHALERQVYLAGTRLLAKLVDNDLPQPLEDGLIPGVGHGEEEPAEDGRCGVAAGEEDAEQLVAQVDGISDIPSQRVEKGARGLFPCSVWFRLEPLLGILPASESSVREAVDDGVDFGSRPPERRSMGQPVQRPQPQTEGNARLHPVDCPREVGVVRRTMGTLLGVDALAKEKVGRRVERVAEEVLKIHDVSPAPRPDAALQCRDEGLDVKALPIEIDLGANEFGSKGRSRVLPQPARGSKLREVSMGPRNRHGHDSRCRWSRSKVSGWRCGWDPGQSL